MTTYYYKISDGRGNGLCGFKTRQEAETAYERQKHLLRKDKEWKIVSYKPMDFELT